MHISVNLDADTINQCLHIHYNYNPSGRRQLKKLVWIPLIMLVLGFYLLYPELKHARYGQNLYLGMLYVSFAVGYYLYMKKRMLKAGKTMVASLGRNAHYEMDINEQQITTIAEENILVTRWDEFTDSLVTPQAVLLYQQNGTFSMFHPRYFAPGEYETFQQWAGNNVRHSIIKS